MEKITTKRNQGSQERQEHIYRTAMGLFKSQGYIKTTVRDICRAAEVSNGSFYHFFGDKSGVLLEFLNRLFSQRADALSPTLPHLQNPYQSIFDYLVFVADTQDIVGRDFARELMGNPDLLAHQQVNARRLIAQNQMVQLLHRSREAGYLPAQTEIETAAELLWTAAGGILFQWVTLTEGESAGAMTRRILPRFFAAVTEEPLITE